MYNLVPVSEETLNQSSLIQLAALQYKLRCMYERGLSSSLCLDSVTLEIQFRFSNMGKTHYTEEEQRAIQSMAGC